MNYAQAFLMSNMHAFPAHQVPVLQRELEGLDDQAATALMMTELKSPTLALVLAIFLGEFGVDRFYTGDKEMGVAKLVLFVVSFVTLFILIGIFLFIGLYIWKFVDCFLIMGACRRANFERVMMTIHQMKAFQRSSNQSVKSETEVVTEAVVEPAMVAVESTVEVVEVDEPIVLEETFSEVEESSVVVSEEAAEPIVLEETFSEVEEPGIVVSEEVTAEPVEEENSDV